MLATSAYMVGRETEYVELLERAYNGHLEDQEPLAAVRCAAWIAVGSSSGARSAAREDGSAAPGGCSSAREAIAWSTAIS